ncbi:tetratricopeptide repeat protein [Myxococcota bacterium]|nr:tetratricopeptide repeat protein [Myxococcota bacterium]
MTKKSFTMVFSCVLGFLLCGIASGCTAAQTTQDSQDSQKSTQALRLEESTQTLPKDVYSTKQLQIIEREESQILLLRQIIAETPPHQKADLLFRLAEHYMDLVRHFASTQRHAEHPAILEKSRTARRNVVRIYFYLAQNYPEYSRLCEVHYFMGKTLFELNEKPTALKVFQSLLRKFSRDCPRFRWIANTHAQIGDIFFEQENYSQAEQSYQQVLALKKSPLVGYALHKIARCAMNQKRYPLALSQFAQAIDWAQKAVPRTTAEQTRRDRLLDESLKDYVFAFSHAGQPKEAKALFPQIGGKQYAPKMLSFLKEIYQNQKKHQALAELERSH